MNRNRNDNDIVIEAARRFEPGAAYNVLFTLPIAVVLLVLARSPWLLAIIVPFYAYAILYVLHDLFGWEAKVEISHHRVRYLKNGFVRRDEAIGGCTWYHAPAWNNKFGLLGRFRPAIIIRFPYAGLLQFWGSVVVVLKSNPQYEQWDHHLIHSDMPRETKWHKKC